MGKSEYYRDQLREIENWDSWLLEESGLPGPRANLELAFVVAEAGDEALFNRYRRLTVEQAPTGSKDEFLAFCGVLGLGRLLDQGQMKYMEALREHASDPRWRIREAVVLALHRFGRSHFDRLLSDLHSWSVGSFYEQRAALAALAHPDLLVKATRVSVVLEMLDRSMESVLKSGERKSGGFQALRKGLGYCWSIVVAAHPELGKPRFVRWMDSVDKDVRWILGSNLKKRRMERMDPDWVRHNSQRLAGQKSS